MEKSNWVIVVTTVITVGGTIAVAMINQQGKAEKQAESERRETARREIEPDPVPPVVEKAPVREERVQRIVDDSSDADPVMPPASTPVRPAIADISGSWHDAQHATYYVQQQGSAIRISSPQYPAGIGGGTVVGNMLRWEYRDSNGMPGTCAGQAVGAQLEVICTSMGMTYQFPMHRPSSG